MSIQEAIMTATRDILSSYLAAELVDQLSDDIMHRAAPDIEAALNEFAGFDFGKNPTSRAKGVGVASLRKSVPRNMRKRKDPSENDNLDETHGAVRSDGQNTEGAEPSAADMA